LIAALDGIAGGHRHGVNAEMSAHFTPADGKDRLAIGPSGAGF
jgi:hypothetical protein